MKKLLEIQNQYIKAMKSHIAKSVELLTAAKSSLSNFIGSCHREGCTKEEPCGFCKSWQKKWDDIDDYLEDNE